MSFRGARSTAQEIGQALNVATLLEGTVRREGPRLRLSAQLVDAADGLTIWSATYEREVRDVFAVQDSLSAAIVAALGERFGVTLHATRRRGTSDLEAYDLYLRGRFFLQKRGEESLRRAAEYFERAVARDSGFAEAWTGIADVQGLLPLYSNTPVDSVLPVALRAVDRAIALDTTLAAAYASRGSLLGYPWRWEEGARDLRTAARLDPDYATAHQWLGENLLIRGRAAEAVEELARAAELDPLSPIVAASHAVALGVARRHPEAIRRGREAVSLDPALPVSRVLLAAVFLYAGEPDSAVRALQAVVAAAPGLALAQGLLGYAYAVKGEHRDALAVVARIDSTVPGSGNAGALARIYLGLGDLDAALDWLERAAEWRDALFNSESLASPLFDPLRGRPRFTAVLRQVNLALPELVQAM